jgi:hypothetical protein
MITGVIHRSILAIVVVSALAVLAGCGIRSDFVPRSAVPGVLITTQTTSDKSPYGLGLEPAGTGSPRITAQAAYAACVHGPGQPCSHKPNRMILGRLGSTPSSYANALVWVFEWDNTTECAPESGPPGPRPATVTTTCTVYGVTDAMIGDGIESVQIG